MVFNFDISFGCYIRKGIQRHTTKQSTCCSQAHHQWQSYGDLCQGDHKLITHQTSKSCGLTGLLWSRRWVLPCLWTMSRWKPLRVAFWYPFFLLWSYSLCLIPSLPVNISWCMTGKDKVLSWIQRLEIAIDSAQGLLFLHTYPAGCIVHRDIKVLPISIVLAFLMNISVCNACW